MKVRMQCVITRRTTPKGTCQAHDEKLGQLRANDLHRRMTSACNCCTAGVGRHRVQDGKPGQLRACELHRRMTSACTCCTAGVKGTASRVWLPTAKTPKGARQTPQWCGWLQAHNNQRAPAEDVAAPCCRHCCCRCCGSPPASAEWRGCRLHRFLLLSFFCP